MGLCEADRWKARVSIHKSTDVWGLWKPMQEHSLLLRSLVVLIASSSLPPSLLSFPQKAASETWGQMCGCLWGQIVTAAFRERCEDHWGHREFDFVWSGSLDCNFASLNRFWWWGCWVPWPVEASFSSSLGVGSGMNKLWEESRPLEIRKNSGLFYKEREAEESRPLLSPH